MRTRAIFARTRTRTRTRIRTRIRIRKLSHASFWPFHVQFPLELAMLPCMQEHTHALASGVSGDAVMAELFAKVPTLALARSSPLPAP